MANPTARVQASVTPVTCEFFYYAIEPSVAQTYYPDEMIGVRLADGYADHFDDTEPMLFLGLFQGPKLALAAADAGPWRVRIRRPFTFHYPLSTGTSLRPTDFGKPAYAVDSGHVALSPGSLTVGNVAGYVFDAWVEKSENLTGVAGVRLTPPALPKHGEGVLTLRPAALTGAVNDYAPSGLAWAKELFVDGGAARNITGLLAGVHGQELWFVNSSETADFDLTLKHASGSSTAANRFLGTDLADVVVRPGGMVKLRYDGTAARWRTAGI